MTQASPDGASLAVRVVPDVTGVDRTFLYLVDAALEIRVGMIVRVSLAGRKVRAWVIALGVEVPDGIECKPIEGIVSLALDEKGVELAHFAAFRYAGWLRPFLLAGSPVRNVLTTQQSGKAKRLQAPVDTPSSTAPDPSDPVIIETLRLLESGKVDLSLPPNAQRLFVVEAFLLMLSARSRLAKSLLVLVPEHRDVETLSRHLRQRGYRCATLPDDYPLAREGVTVVIGTRNAAFSPVGNLGGILVLDIHSESYTGQRAPTWNAPVIARERARLASVPLLMTSPCPPLLLTGVEPPAEFDRQFQRAHWPTIDIIDRRMDDPRSGLYSPDLARVIRQALSDDARQVVCVLHRIGRLRLLACNACGEIARCGSCAGAMQQRERAEQSSATLLTCASCGATRPVVCALCGSSALKTLRVGATRAAEELSALVGVETQLVTGESRGKRGPESGVPSARVLVGTEAVLHRARAASLVVMLDFDQHLLAPRFVAAEEALALIALAGRLVGARGVRSGSSFTRRLVIQSRLPGHVVLQSAIGGDPGLVREDESIRRKEARLPPFSAIALVSGARADEVNDRLSGDSRVEVFPYGESAPTKGTTAPTQYLVRAATTEELCGALEHAHARGQEVRIEVDPSSI